MLDQTSSLSRQGFQGASRRARRNPLRHTMRPCGRAPFARWTPSTLVTLPRGQSIRRLTLPAILSSQRDRLLLLKPQLVVQQPVLQTRRPILQIRRPVLQIRRPVLQTQLRCSPDAVPHSPHGSLPCRKCVADSK
ncbi:unnamed protein product [Lampetra planeri]